MINATDQRYIRTMAPEIWEHSAASQGSIAHWHLLMLVAEKVMELLQSKIPCVSGGTSLPKGKSPAFQQLFVSLLEDAKLLPPSITSWVDQDCIRKWVRLIGGNGRDVISLLADCCHDPHRRFLQALFHQPSVPYCFWLAPRTRQGNLDYPVLPHCFLFTLDAKPACFASLLLEKLHDDGAAARLGIVLRRLLSRRGIQRTKKRGRPALDETLYVIF